VIVLREPECVVDGLTLPECPRWHDGVLYFSDVRAGRILRMGEGGVVQEIYASPDDFVSGLGFLSDGSLICVSQKRRQLLRIVGGRVIVYADLSGFCRFVLNDLAVTGDHAYVSQPGYDVWEGLPEGLPPATELIVVSPQGRARIAARGLKFPNGIAGSSDGRTLHVAETAAMRISSFSIIGAEGGLRKHRTHAVLPSGATPDGICLDSEGGVWAAAPFSAGWASFAPGPGVWRLASIGVATHVVPGRPGRRALACVFGGTDRSTLYVCTVADAQQDAARGHGRIERVALHEFQGAGVP
jgi:sugar lactone lactonase YvrE